MNKCVCGHPKEAHDRQVISDAPTTFLGGKNQSVHIKGCTLGRCGCSGFEAKAA